MMASSLDATATLAALIALIVSIWLVVQCVRSRKSASVAALLPADLDEEATVATIGSHGQVPHVDSLSHDTPLELDLVLLALGGGELTTDELRRRQMEAATRLLAGDLWCKRRSSREARRDRREAQRREHQRQLAERRRVRAMDRARREFGVDVLPFDALLAAQPGPDAKPAGPPAAHWERPGIVPPVNTRPVDLV